MELFIDFKRSFDDWDQDKQLSFHIWMKTNSLFVFADEEDFKLFGELNLIHSWFYYFTLISIQHCTVHNTTLMYWVLFYF